MKNISLKFQKKQNSVYMLRFYFIQCISNDRALHSVGAAMEKGNSRYVFKLCKTELKEGACIG